MEGRGHEMDVKLHHAHYNELISVRRDGRITSMHREIIQMITYHLI